MVCIDIDQLCYVLLKIISWKEGRNETTVEAKKLVLSVGWEQGVGTVQHQDIWGLLVLTVFLPNLWAESGGRNKIPQWTNNKLQNCDWTRPWCVISPKNTAFQNGSEISQRMKPQIWKMQKWGLEDFVYSLHFLLLLFVCPVPSNSPAQ